MEDDGGCRPGGGFDGRSLEAPTIRPSTVKLPERPPQGVQTIFDFFLHRFPRIPRETWVERFAAGKVWVTAKPIDAGTSCAVALLTVGSFSVTSTIRTFPFSSRWVKFGIFMAFYLE